MGNHCRDCETADHHRDGDMGDRCRDGIRKKILRPDAGAASGR